MVSIRLKVLGCSGSESAEEHPCSFLLGDSVLIDAGSVAATLPLEQQTKIRSVFLTHCHLDHIKDLAFLAENVFPSEHGSIKIFGHADVLQAVQQHFFNNVIWPDFSKLPSSTQPLFEYQPIESGGRYTLDELPGVEIEACAVNHPGPTLGFLVHGKKQTVVYVGDTGPTDQIWRAMQACQNLTDVFVECSFPNKLNDLAHVAQHLTSELLAAEIDKLGRDGVNFHVYHIKAPYKDVVLSEVKALDDPRLHVLAAGDSFDIT